MAGENINRRLNIYINDKEVVNSLGGITRGMTSTRNSIRNLEKGTDDYDEKLKALKETYKKLSEEQDKFKKEIAETPSILQKIKGALGPVASGMIAAFSIGSLVSGAMAALGNAKRVLFEFEQGVADLSAITGAAGKDLEFLKNKAIELGEKTQGGAVAVIEAYKLIASAKPELLQNVEALNSVTEATLLLAKASGMEMPLAATKLTDAMNQFNAPASEAAKYVDVLAAGAKYGAAEIPQLTDAVLEFGAVAKVSNVDIKESVALVELMAEKGQKGAEAGTKIRNILLQVLSGGNTAEARKELDKYGISIDDLKNKSIPFSEKLESLKPLLKDVASVTQVFGKENATAAITLIENTKRLKELTSQVGEFGIAEQQAAIKMDTVNNKTELLKSKYESLIISIGNGKGVVSGFFKFFIDGASNALGLLIRMNSSWEEIYGKAASKGKSLGEADFQKRMNSVGFATSTDFEKANMVLEKALDERAELLKRKNANNKEIAEKSSGGFFSKYVVGSSSQRNQLKKEQEQLILDIAARDAIIRKAKSKLNPVKSGGTTTTDATGGDAVVLDDTAAKKREKAIDDAKKHSEALKKELETSQKELLASQRAGQDAEFAGQKESYDKELGLLNEEYDRKIEDTKIKVATLQEEIAKLNTDLKDPKNSKADNDVIKSTIASKIAAQKEYSDTIISIDQARNFKLGALQEKYLEKSFQKEQEDHARKLLLLKTDQDNQLAGITTLEQAKEILSATMSEKELRGVTTLEEAKKIIKANNLKEQLKLEIENLDKIVAAYKAALSEDSPGFNLISDEEKDKLNAALDEANAKVAALKLTMSGGTDPAAKDNNGGDIDILGFTKDQWEAAFTNIDDLETALAAVKMVAAALTTAFSAYFKSLEAGEARTLQKFQKAADNKKKTLADQLEKGIISQEVYNARMAKIDADLAKKKAEIEYKQAKRQKQMAIVNAIIGTAVAVINALSTQPVWLGIAMGAIIGTMGALNIASIAKQPLPDKSGFKAGGFTGRGNENDSPGPVHYDEYVIPKKVLFGNDPVVPNIVGYLEAKRTGKQPMNPQEETNSSSTNSQGGSGSSKNNSILNALIQRLSSILEKIEEEGIQSYLVNDYKTAKKMRDKIKEVTKNETNAKP